MWLYRPNPTGWRMHDVRGCSIMGVFVYDTAITLVTSWIVAQQTFAPEYNNSACASVYWLYVCSALRYSVLWWFECLVVPILMLRSEVNSKNKFKHLKSYFFTATPKHLTHNTDIIKPPCNSFQITTFLILQPAARTQICDSAFSTTSTTSQVTVAWDSSDTCLPDSFAVTVTGVTDSSDTSQCDIQDKSATTQCTHTAIAGRTYNIVAESDGQTISPSLLQVTARK